MKIFKINNFNYHHTIASVAKNKNVQEDLLERGNTVLFVDNDIVLQPDNVLIEVSPEEKTFFNSLSEYDVIEINQCGVIHTLYQVSSDDNAIVVTSKCNSNCIMCPSSEFVRKNAETNHIKQLLKIASHIPDEIPFLTITGGEPTLIKSDFFVLLNYLKDRFPYTQFLLLTNGRAFSNYNYTRKFCEYAPDNIRVGIPIYGENSLIHDGITRSPGSFSQAIGGIINLLEVGADVEVRVVISKLNADHLFDIAELCVMNFKGLECVNFMGLEMCGNAVKNASDVWIDYDIAFGKMRRAIEYLVSNGIDTQIYNFPLCMVDKRFWSICAKSISGYKVRYRPECAKCRVKTICGGIFRTTLKFSNLNVKPI